MLKSGPAVLVFCFAALWLGLLVAFPAGLWVPDETVIYAAAESLRREGSLVVDNGYSMFENRALLFNDLLKVGPNGTVVQYPAGYTALLVPFSVVGGLKGMMAVNALSAVISVWLTYKIAVLLFAEHRIALRATVLLGLCSYLVVYATALWPHAISTAIVLAACWFALRAIRTADEGRKDAFMLGLVLGLGLSVRVDVVLIGPALLAVILFSARRPAAMIAQAAIGFLPGMLLAIWFNYLKFGSLSPISYGVSKGGTSLESYVPLAAATLIFLTLCLIARHLKSRGVSVAVVTGLVALLGVASVALPALQPIESALRRLFQGILTLWVDMRLLGDESHQVTRHPDGTVTVFGLYKKAVAQSMPWIGILGLLAVHRLRPADRFGLGVCTLALVVWTLPFARTAWHGGFATNMRYFLPVIPFLCILAALALERLPPVHRRTALGLWVGGGSAAAIGVLAAPGLTDLPAQAVLQHTLPLIFLTFLVIAAVLSALGTQWAMLTRLGFAACISLGLLNTYAFDLLIDKTRRIENAKTERLLSTLPDNSFFYAMIYEPMLFQIRRGDPIAARNRYTNQLDPDLIATAQAQGFTVYVQTEMLRDQALAAQPGTRATQVFADKPLILPLYRLDPAE